MNLLNQLLQMFKNLASLGQTRLLAMAGVAIVSFALIISAAIFVNKPAYETLYVGLEPTDLNQVSIALAESGIDFETGTDGKSLKVPAGMTSKARLLLAERGLPNSANAGYELFDNVGSLGLTSFMQEVTRVRALEGEIARTIQQINGIAAARVHIVLPDVGNFRRGEQKPTASVMIRASSETGRKAASSIRHMVASAVPGLDVEDVTILDSTGQLLASGDENGGPANRSLGVVQSVQQEIESNIDKALAPFLGMDNFRSSVTAQLNTDTQQIQETVYDPESRVERSVRVTKEAQKSQSRAQDTAATVEQNVPQSAPQGGVGGPESSDEANKKEEQTNYEINSKTIATVKNSYTVEKLSVAVVVNKGRIAKMVGEPVDQAKVDAYLAEMQKIVSSAAGLNNDRGDVVTLTAMDFLENQLLEEAASGPGVMDMLSRNLGGIINSLAFVAVAFLIVWMGIRPMVRTANGGAAAIAGGSEQAAGLELPDFSPALGGTGGGALMDGFGSDFGFDSTDDLLTMEEDPNGGFNRRVKEGPERRLSRMVEISEERAAKILRKWAVDKAA
ncbi:flagellar M-ring protein FliF [Rhizobium sp. S95]|uniref:Flagellar M-ring protein n=1 Tax=Ciceribacter sichuanensis TaxID=2949647 RepID=A0AAJ1C184_9HYPH|nr:MULTISPECIES: flagellar basal-body MS-ring/collar protein FliF [unclassified Ciceribacter]MCM2396095.1 flagellar M-ring protein FliF [Ciceribacter sp. S95]MCM2401092.1 flagellar M-ring protein FliF [Ciceribacter sp. S153]MCO5959952.1 flagellar M-ring protein FliF [Ciceribacter sp. S101]